MQLTGITKVGRILLIILIVMVIACFSINIPILTIDYKYTLIGPKNPVVNMITNHAPLQKIKDELNKNPKAINTYSYMHETMLAFAADDDRTNIVELLLSMGADPNGRIGGNTKKPHTPPLYYAVQNNNLHMIRILLEAGADPAERNKYGMTVYDFMIKDKNINPQIWEYLNKAMKKIYGSEQNYPATQNAGSWEPFVPGRPMP